MLGFAAIPFLIEGPSLDELEAIPMTWMIGVGALMIAGLAWGAVGYVISPDRMGRPAQEVAREQDLLCRLGEIDERFTDDFWRRYDQLVTMRKAEALAPGSPEHAELIRMTGELESGQADRLVLAAELAKIRGVSLAEVLKGGDIAVWNHG